MNPLVQENSLWKESSDMLGSHLSLNMSHCDLSAGLSGEGGRDLHTHTHTKRMHDSTRGHANTPTSSRFPPQVSMHDLIWHRMYVGDGG